MDSEIRNLLKDYLEGQVTRSAFRRWISGNEQKLKLVCVTPGEMLKLKCGDRITITRIYERLDAADGNLHVFEEGIFANLNAFARCERAVNAAVKNAVLKKIPQPDWYRPPKAEIGQSLFFESMKSGAIWNLLLPERASRGHWKRVGQAMTQSQK